MAGKGQKSGGPRPPAPQAAYGSGFRQPNTPPAWTFAKPSGMGLGISGGTILEQRLIMTPEVRPGLDESEVAERIVRPRRREPKG